MKSIFTACIILMVQVLSAQTIEAKAKLINQYTSTPDSEPVLVNASASENSYIINLNELFIIENPKDGSGPKAKIRQSKKLENGNYQIDIENASGEKEIELLIDFINKKLVFYLEIDTLTKMEIQYLLKELTLKN